MNYLVAFAGLVFMVAGCGGENTENTPQKKTTQTSAKAGSKYADACDLLVAADPSKILSGTVSEPSLNSTTCTVTSGDGHGSISLALEPGGDTIHSKDDFWENSSQGLSILGIGIDDLREIDGLGKYAVWFPQDDAGVQLWAFWDNTTAMVNVLGVPEDAALSWAKEAVAMAIGE